jgi:hypothetical protein
MKKLIFGAVALVVMTTAGFVTARLQKSHLRFPPHTIVYRLEFYDESQKLTTADILIRRVEADGSWKHTQVRADGSVQVSNGRLTGFLTSKQPDHNSREHLKVKYIEERNRKGDTNSWISPELQDMLLFTTFRSDGSKDSEMRAIDISRN